MHNVLCTPTFHGSAPFNAASQLLAIYSVHLNNLSLITILQTTWCNDTFKTNKIFLLPGPFQNKRFLRQLTQSQPEK